MFNKFKALFGKHKPPPPPSTNEDQPHSSLVSSPPPPPPSAPSPSKHKHNQTQTETQTQTQTQIHVHEDENKTQKDSITANTSHNADTTQVIHQDDMVTDPKWGQHDNTGLNENLNHNHIETQEEDASAYSNSERDKTTAQMHMEQQQQQQVDVATGRDTSSLEDDSQDVSFTISDITLSSTGLSYSGSSSSSSSLRGSRSFSSVSNDVSNVSQSESSSTKLKVHQRPSQATPRGVFKEQSELPDYTLIKKIGEGAFSKVYKATPNPENFLARNFKEVAVKVIKKSVLSRADNGQTRNSNNNAHKHKHKLEQPLSPTSPDCKPSTREQVLKEVRLHKSITAGRGCPYIVQFIEFKETKSYYYIVQEYLRGGEVFNEIVKFTYFSENLSRHITRQLALAIKHLHSLGIVHRDIKPENLLFNPIEYIPSSHPRLRRSDDPTTKLDEGLFRPNVGGGGIGVVKLADFGLSKQIFHTNTKTPCGTVGYTAPEVVKDERYSMKVDMWGIGCVLYTMLCGFPPFFDDKINVLTEKISRGEYAFLSPWWDEISDGAKNCVRRLLELDPDKRYTVDQLLHDPWLNRYELNEEEMELERERQRQKTSTQRSNNSYNNNSKAHKRRLHSKPADSTLLYSPAAVAMRDAFDISNAVQRDEEERVRRHSVQLNSLNEGEEVTEFSDAVTNNLYGNLDEKLFQLKLNASTIVKRRKQRKDAVGRAPMGVTTAADTATSTVTTATTSPLHNDVFLV